jgi:hypothetical protein
MQQRCGNPNHDSYARYGGRGISVCEAWREFAVFAEWARAAGYRDDKQIDRIDNDGPYEPSNCRWTSDAENKRNTSQTTNLTAYGETKCLTDWALDTRCAVAPATIRHRLRHGFSPEDAISAQRQSKKSAERFRGHHLRSGPK